MMRLFITLGGVGILLLAGTPARIKAREVTIELPLETGRYREAPGAALATAFCLTCHSADYVEMQPPMPRAFWEAEVKKMKEKYLAPIPAGVDGQLVDYFTSAYGVPATDAGRKK